MNGLVRVRRRVRSGEQGSVNVPTYAHTRFFAARTLANAFPPCGLAVATAVDGVVYDSDVYEASRRPAGDWGDETGASSGWGSNAVLVLAGIRLGVDGVNPVYHECIKVRESRAGRDIAG